MNRFGWIWAASALGPVLAGCGGNSGVFNQPLPRIRAVNALDGVASANVVAGGTTVASGLAYGTASTPYAITTDATYPVVFANAASPTPPIVSTVSHTYTLSDRFTAIAYGSGNSVATILLRDNRTNAPSGTISLRFVNAAAQLASADIFVTTSNNGPYNNPITLAVGQVYPAQTSNAVYSSITAPNSSPGTYYITVFPAGNDTGTPLVQTQISLSNMDRWTFTVTDPVTNGGSYVIAQGQENNQN